MENFPEIIAVGHLCMDKISICEDYPAENSSRHVLEYSQHPGGTAAQAIVAAARLGAKTAYMSPLGDDESGRELLSDCEAEGVDMSMCRIDKGVTTHFTNVFVNRKRNTRTFLSYHGKFSPMSFGYKEKNYIKNAKILHLDNTRNENAVAAAKIAKEAGCTVSVDGSTLNPDNEKNWELVKLTDVLITSDTYPGRLTGIKDRYEALEYIRNKIKPRILISTNGEKGCTLCEASGFTEFPAYNIKPLDTTGAGDAFHGAFLFGLLKGYELPYNIKFSSAVAALSCMKVGGRDGLPTFEQTMNFIENNKLP